jgi:hypothetical protein
MRDEKEWKKCVFEVNATYSISDAMWLLGISYRTFTRWERTAIESLKCYRKEMEQISQEAEANGLLVLPVTSYRLWLVGKVGLAFSALPRGTTKVWLVKKLLQTKPSQFSRKAYLQEKVEWSKLKECEPEFTEVV